MLVENLEIHLKAFGPAKIWTLVWANIAIAIPFYMIHAILHNCQKKKKEKKEKKKLYGTGSGLYSFSIST